MGSNRPLSRSATVAEAAAATAVQYSALYPLISRPILIGIAAASFLVAPCQVNGDYFGDERIPALTHPVISPHHPRIRNSTYLRASH